MALWVWISISAALALIVSLLRPWRRSRRVGAWRRDQHAQPVPGLPVPWPPGYGLNLGESPLFPGVCACCRRFAGR